MSSARGSIGRHPSDYYVTPEWVITEYFNTQGRKVLSQIIETLDRNSSLLIFDPCGGGCDKHPNAYHEALKKILNPNTYTLISMDIRDDAKVHIPGVDYLQTDILKYLPRKPDLILSNPPFYLAKEFILKAQEDLSDATQSYVIYLLSVLFLGSKVRKDFIQHNLPRYIGYSSRRPGFYPENPSKTDSVNYAHMAWKKSTWETPSELVVI